MMAEMQRIEDRNACRIASPMSLTKPHYATLSTHSPPIPKRDPDLQVSNNDLQLAFLPPLAAAALTQASRLDAIATVIEGMHAEAERKY